MISDNFPAFIRKMPLMTVLMVKPRPIKLGLTLISSTIKRGKIDRLIPKRTHDVMKEMMSALRYGLRARADFNEIVFRSCVAVGLAASTELRSKNAPEALAPIRRNP